jgi:thiol-disulfide isomerase/thioredoxin
MRRILKITGITIALSLTIFGFQFANNVPNSGNDEIQIIENYESIFSFKQLVNNPKFKDKVLYVDIWGVYCKPCIEEFNHIQALKDSFKNKPVEFVYLASPYKRSNDVAKWKSGMKKYNLTGHNMLMFLDFYNGIWEEIPEMKEPFLIPHYLIVNKDGKIVNPNAPRPSSKKTLYEEITELL